MKNNSLDKQYLKLVKKVKNKGVAKGDRTGTGTISLFGTQIRHDMSEGFPILTSKQMSLKSISAELIWFLSGSTDIRDLWKMGCTIWDGDFYKRYKTTTLNSATLLELKENCYDTTKFADNMFDLGPIYNKQWRDFHGVDQISNLIRDIKQNPDSRRLLVSAWDPSKLDEVILPPCHIGFQCYTTKLTREERIALVRSAMGKAAYQSALSDMVPFDGGLSVYYDFYQIPTRKLSLMWSQRSVDTLLG